MAETVAPHQPEAGRPASGRVVLVRHGETDANREPLRVQGFSDVPLNDTGRRQAGEAAERLVAEAPRFHSLWASDLSRARETAEIIGERLGLAVRLDPRLREADRGRWEGRLFREIEREEPEGYSAWRHTPATWRFPGGESLAEQQHRVRAAVAAIRAAGELPALVVCHGGSIRVMLCLRDPRGLAAFHEFSVPNLTMVEA